jgi:hypothetical protein
MITTERRLSRYGLPGLELQLWLRFFDSFSNLGARAMRAPPINVIQECHEEARLQTAVVSTESRKECFPLSELYRLGLQRGYNSTGLMYIY